MALAKPDLSVGPIAAPQSRESKIHSSMCVTYGGKAYLCAAAWPPQLSCKWYANNVNDAFIKTHTLAPLIWLTAIVILLVIGVWLDLVPCYGKHRLWNQGMDEEPSCFVWSWSTILKVVCEVCKRSKEPQCEATSLLSAICYHLEIPICSAPFDCSFLSAFVL